MPMRSRRRCWPVRAPFAVDPGVGVPEPAQWTPAGGTWTPNLYPLIRRLGPGHVTAAFGRKTRGRSWLAIEPARPDPAPAAPQFTALVTGSYVRPDWKRMLHQRLVRAGITQAPAGPLALRVAIGTSPARSWTNPWKLLIDSLGPILGEHDGPPFHPYDDRIVDLSLHHHTSPGLGHDVQVGLWWATATAATVPA
jgi:hypothetical protein